MRGVISIVIAVVVGFIGLLIWVAVGTVAEPWIPETASVGLETLYPGMNALPKLMLMGMVSLLGFAIAVVRGGM